MGNAQADGAGRHTKDPACLTEVEVDRMQRNSVSVRREVAVGRDSRKRRQVEGVKLLTQVQQGLILDLSRAFQMVFCPCWPRFT